MHFPPLARASPFQFPSSRFNSTSLLFIPPQPSRFIISATTDQTTPSSPQALKFDYLLINRDGFFPDEHSTRLIPIQEAQTRSKSVDGNFETLTEFNHHFMDLVLADEVDVAYKLYSSLSDYELSADSWTFSILIHCYCKINEPMEGKKVLEHMIRNGFESPNVKTFTRVISSFCKRGRVTQAFQVLELMGKVNCEPTINTYNCLLKGLCYVGRVEEAYQMLSKIMKSWKVKPDIYTYTAVMDGFCKVGRSDEALELLVEAIEMGLTPSIVTYNTLFNGYFKEGRPMEGFNILKQMKERDCIPDYISYSTLLHGLLQWGEIRAGVRVCNEMLEMGFEADERMMNTLLRGLCRRSRKERELLRDAYGVFDEMSKRGCRIDPCAYELMVEAFCNGDEMDKAFVSFCEMMRMGLSTRTFTSNIVVRGLCMEGKIEKAMMVLVWVCRGRSEMISRATFDVLINAMNPQRMLTGAACVYCAALKKGVIPPFHRWL